MVEEQPVRFPCRRCGATVIAELKNASTRLPAGALEQGWFIIRDGTFDGPHPTSNVVAEAQRGAVKPQTLLWRSGMSRWKSRARRLRLSELAEESVVA